MNGTIMDLTHGTGNVCKQVRYTLSLESEEQILIMHRNGSVSAFSLCHNIDHVIPLLPNY